MVEMAVDGMSVSDRILLCVLCIVSSTLFAGNIFFVKRLVDQIDTTQQLVLQLREEIAVLKFSVEEMKHQRFK